MLRIFSSTVLTSKFVCHGLSPLWPDDTNSGGSEDFNISNSSMSLNLQENLHNKSLPLIQSANTDHVTVNVNGVYFMTAFCVPLLRKAVDPNVIIISSIAGLSIQRVLGLPTYSISKAAGKYLSYPSRLKTIWPPVL